jgi:uncharacterized protein (TIGR00255 family)
MTGFGSAEGTVGSSRVAVEVRSVNHRFFSPSIKLPGALARWETEVREALRKSVSRGHVTLTARLEREPADDIATIDEGKFAAYVGKLRQLKDRHSLSDELDVATVLRLPDVVSMSVEEEPGTPAELVEIVERAAESLGAARASEGARLCAFLSDRIRLIEEAVDRLARRAPERLAEHRERMRANVATLLQGVPLDEQRVAQELALMADRLDVGEEMDRFRSHLTAFRETLGKPSADGVGKRLGFLLQELLREANTTGSKANDVAMTREVVAIKEELERIREQVENLE